MLTAEQIAIVQKELETALPEGEMICIPQGRLYERLMDKIDMEQYQFCQLVKDAIKNDAIKGFETRHGRKGGICRAGAFKQHDEKRKRNCHVTINGKTYKVSVSESQIFALIVAALNGQPTTDGTNAVYIGNAAYKLPTNIDAKDILLNYLINVYNAKLQTDQTSRSDKETGT